MLRGKYSAETSYSVDDVVKYTDGEIYRLHNPAPSGTSPMDTRFWTRQQGFTRTAALMAIDAMEAAEGEIPDVANDLTVTAAGKVLDARQGKALKDLIDALTERVAALEEAAVTQGGTEGGTEGDPEGGSGSDAT